MTCTHLCILIAISGALAVPLNHNKRSSSSGGDAFIDAKQGDLSFSQLTQLYNTKVTYMEEWRRPLLNLPNWTRYLPFLYHTGMKVILESPVDGDTVWVVHKGDRYGKATQTVVARASYMSSNWTFHGRRSVCGNYRVTDFIREGGTNYDIWSDNCQDAVERMWNNLGC